MTVRFLRIRNNTDAGGAVSTELTRETVVGEGGTLYEFFIRACVQIL